MSAQSRFPDLRARKRPAWELVYINLMTLLMIFFMVLYAMEAAGQTAGMEAKYEQMIGALEEMFGGDGNVKRVARAERRDTERRVAKDLEDAAPAGARIEVSRRKIKITLPNPVLFGSGSAQLRKDSLKGLVKLAKRLKTLSKNAIVIEGHTDDIPLIPGSAFKDNFELSAHRALGILHFLADNGGLDPAQLTPVGFGEFRPESPNTSAENRAKNRRIEIHIIREE